MAQVFNGGYFNMDRATMQHYRCFAVTYEERVTAYTLQHCENINKLVQVRMNPMLGHRELLDRPWKYTSFLKEMMKLTVVHNDEDVPTVQALIPTASGMDMGSAQIMVNNNVPAAIALVEGMKKAVVAW